MVDQANKNPNSSDHGAQISEASFINPIMKEYAE
jgi:hypothetical protein